MPSKSISKGFMDAVVHNEESYIDGYCMHGYNNDGGNGWKKAGFLSEVLHQAVALKSELRKRSSTMPLWLGNLDPTTMGVYKMSQTVSYPHCGTRMH